MMPINANLDEAILLLSGGIDSTTLLAELSLAGKKIHALTFDYGQKHKVEIEFARRNGKSYNVFQHKIIQLDTSVISGSSSLISPTLCPKTYKEKFVPNDQTDVYVPGRNLMMLSHAAAYAEAHSIREIYFAVNLDDRLRFPDCSPDFFESLNRLLFKTLKTGLTQFIVTPYLELTKAEVISRSRNLNLNLADTLSCYHPKGEIECGECLSCILKMEAMLSNPAL